MILLLRSVVTVVALLSVSCATVSDDPAAKLVGRWQSQTQAQTAEYVFKPNGTFTGTVAASGTIVSNFTGRWSLKAGVILYDYTGDTLGRIPAGTKDQDKLLSIAADHFMIEAADGSRRKYVRAGS